MVVKRLPYVIPKKPFLFYPHFRRVPCYPLEGIPLEEVSKLLGHTSIKTTEKSYAKWVQARQDRLDSLVIATWDEDSKGGRLKRMHFWAT